MEVARAREEERMKACAGTNAEETLVEQARNLQSALARATADLDAMGKRLAEAGSELARVGKDVDREKQARVDAELARDALILRLTRNEEFNTTALACANTASDNLQSTRTRLSAGEGEGDMLRVAAAAAEFALDCKHCADEERMQHLSHASTRDIEERRQHEEQITQLHVRACCSLLQLRCLKQTVMCNGSLTKLPTPSTCIYPHAKA